jgi:hypothetical protein
MNGSAIPVRLPIDLRIPKFSEMAFLVLGSTSTPCIICGTAAGNQLKHTVQIQISHPAWHTVIFKASREPGNTCGWFTYFGYGRINEKD